MDEQVPGTRSGGVWAWLYLALAAFFFAISILGVLLPVLPTTPFLLLTSYFLARSSPKLNAALLKSRLFGPILQDWQQRGGIRLHIRCKSIAIVILVISISIWLSQPTRPVLVAMVAAALVGILVILRLPSART